MLIVVVLLPWLHMQGQNTETKIEDIKNFLSDHGQMAWVEYPKNATEVGLLLGDVWLPWLHIQCLK